MDSTVYVIATTVDGTRAALATAVPLAKGSRSSLVVIVPRIASVDIETKTEVDSTAFFVRRYEELLHDVGGSARVEAWHGDAIDQLVSKMGSAKARVVVGGPVGRWITSPEERFASHLTRAGCDVVFAASGVNPTQRRIAPSVAAIAAIGILFGSAWPASAQTTPSREDLLKRITALEAEIAELRAIVEQKPAETTRPEVAEDEKVFLDYLHDLKFGVTLDTYYEYNVNQPIGRVNLLRGTTSRATTSA